MPIGTGEVSPTLRAQSHHHQPLLINAMAIIDEKATEETMEEETRIFENHAQDARYRDAGDCAPTCHSQMGTGGNNVPLVYTKTAHPQNAEESQGFREAEVAKTLNTFGTPNSEMRAEELVCFQQNQRDEVREMEVPGALQAEPGMKQQNYITAFNPGQSKDGGLGYEEENSPTIRANSSANDPAIAIAPMVIGRKPENGGNQIGYNESGAAYTNDTSSPQGVCKHGIVRRLLPIETERLMGFPDNWTRIPWKGRPEEECPDSPRYKACGNSMCVNCMEWIGRRIQMVEDRIKCPH